MRGPSNRGNRRALKKVHSVTNDRQSDFAHALAVLRSSQKTGAAMPFCSLGRVLRQTPAVVTIAVGFGSAACSSAADPAPGPRPALQSLPRPLSAQEEAIRTSANAFSFSLWRQLNQATPGENVFTSPLSASFALGMALGGARGQTYDEMHTTLALPAMEPADIGAGYKSLIGLLTSLDPRVTMEIANSIWYRRGFTPKQTFLDQTRDAFDATISPLDFSNAAASLAAINGWVSDRTHRRITSILDEIHGDDLMFLINAIYFKGGWREKFDPARTSSAPFHGVGGDRTIPFMSRAGTIAYAESPTYQAIELPYGDSAFAMTIVLPAATSSVAEVAASLTSDSWAALTSNLHTAQVELWLPKLKLEWERTLNSDLEALGMQRAFTDAADFTGISSDVGLMISSVRQKAYVDVNEEGTEAAAATSVGMVLTSAPVRTTVRVDRPFIFAIRERLSGTVLFLATVNRLPGN